MIAVEAAKLIAVIHRSPTQRSREMRSRLGGGQTDPAAPVHPARLDAAILLARELSYPAQAAFDIAHEMGHMALGHLDTDSVVADFEDPLRGEPGIDAEEDAANRYALELLTGDRQPKILPSVDNFLARDLANTARDAAPQLGIDAGTLILCLGHHTQRWDKIFAALRILYGGTQPVAEQLNRVSIAQLQNHLSFESEEFLRSVLGVG